MRETRFGKRCLTWVLVLVMTLSLLPVSALAEDGEEPDEAATLHCAMFTSMDARDTDSESEFEEQGDDVTVNEVADGEEEDKASDDIESDDADDETVEYDVSKSKTATQLNKRTWTSKVTLSLPSAEENLATDVVFVLDGSSSADTGVVKESLTLLESLKDSASDSGAAVNVCIVKFKRQAFKSDWYDLSKDFEAIKTAMETKYSGGTNIHAGLLAGKEALEEHTNVSANRKYLILISDGSTYLYSKDGNWASDKPFTRTYYTKDNFNKAATGGYWDNGLYEPNNYPDVNVPRPKTTSDVAAWQAYLKDVEARNAESHGDDYDYHCDYVMNFILGKPSDDFKSQPCEKRTANNRDMAFYYADQVWQQIKNAGYIAYSIATEDGMAGAGNADDSHCFMNYLNGGKSLDFSDIKKEILYAVSAGSTVTDTIGDKFTFGGVDSFVLIVGGDKIEGAVDTSDTNTVNFGDVKEDETYPYTITYTPADKTFVWTINEDVSNFAPVQLSYTVRLTKPETNYGTYGVTDLDGDGYVDGTTNTTYADADALYTNEYAKLTPTNSAGVQGKAEDFPKPSVSYTVSRPHHPSKPDNTVEIPDEDALGLNTDDHFAYIIGYPDGTVQPNGQITRAEATTIFFRLLTDESRDANLTKTNRYADVAADAWYNTAVSTMTKAGIVDGYPDGTFRPDAPITRAEMAKIISLFAKLDKSESRFSDIAGHWAEAYIKLVAGNGWIAGYPDGTFGPQRNITRAETATMINRVLDRVPSEESRLLSRDVMQIWPDANPSDWFYLAMQEATNSHDYERNAKWAAADEQWTALRETRDWKALEQ